MTTKTKDRIVISGSDFERSAAYARFHKCDPQAHAVYANLSLPDRVQLRFAPLKIGVVDWGEWEPEFFPEKAGNKEPRTLPLYLLSHGTHKTLPYPNGFPGSNERLPCHCGFLHYMPGSRGPHLKDLIALGLALGRA